MIVVSCLLRPQEDPTLPFIKRNKNRLEKELLKKELSASGETWERSDGSSLPSGLSLSPKSGRFEDLKLEEEKFSFLYLLRHL